MINQCDDESHPTPQGPNHPKHPFHVLTLQASQLHDALLKWQAQKTMSIFKLLDFWPPDIILHENILEYIVVLVDTGKIINLQDLHKKSNWIFCDRYGDQVFSLIQSFFAASLSSPFVSTPLPLWMPIAVVTPAVTTPITPL